MQITASIKAKPKQFNVLIPSRTRLIGRRRPIRVFTPRRGRYPFWESEKPPRPVPALSGTGLPAGPTLFNTEPVDRLPSHRYHTG